jgi:hypothetical protein
MSHPRYRLPLLIGLTVLLAPMSLRGGLTGTDLFIPAVARTPGQAGSNFFSTVWVSNIGDAPATVEFRFHETNQSNTNPVKFTDTVGLGETKRYDNIVERYFGRTNTSGAIRVISSNEVYVSSRTYSLAPGGNIRDSNGLFFSAVPTSQAIGLNQSAIIQGITQGASEDFRYNAGLVEVAGQTVTVLVTIRDAGTKTLGSKSYTIPAFGRIQFPVTDVAPSIVSLNAVAEARVTTGGGRVIVFGTQIANGSNDSAGFEMNLRASAGTPISGQVGDRCTSTASGQRLTILGDQYVLVEVEVILENSTDRYALRYPVKIQGGTNPSIDSPMTLRAVCYRSPLFECTYPCQTGSICGYQALFCPESDLRCNYQSYPSQPIKWTCYVEGSELITILVDDAHNPIFLNFQHTDQYAYSVQDASAFNFNFISANYPRPNVDPASLPLQLDVLATYISLKKR